MQDQARVHLLSLQHTPPPLSERNQSPLHTHALSERLKTRAAETSALKTRAAERRATKVPFNTRCMHQPWHGVSYHSVGA